ncbi:MAG: alpha/beta fold hydrolase [Nanoarchaeota archaeon]|nr:alpha/beta fold hydrolase [Nanoarchaeota archaeon]
MSEKVFFKNRKGEKLVGLLDHVSFNKIVVALHGFTSNKQMELKRMVMSPKLTKLGFSFFSFDFAGCGESDGDFNKTSIKSRSQDFKSSLLFLKSLGYKKFAVVGFSMGSAVAIQSWSKKIKVMALVVPLTQPKNVSKRLEHPNSIVKLVEKKMFEAINTKVFYDEIRELNLNKNIEKITSPTLLVQAKQDTLILKRDSKKTYKLLSCKKKYFEVIGTHLLLFPLSFDKILDEIIIWFKKYF